MKKITILSFITLMFCCYSSLSWGTKKHRKFPIHRRSTASVHSTAAKRYQRKLKHVSRRKRFRALHTPHNYSRNGHIAYLHSNKSIPDWLTSVTPTGTNDLPNDIHSYAFANGLPYPEFFIMRKDEFLQFLQSGTEYSHFYLSINDVTGGVDLVMTGASKDPQGGFIDNIPLSPSNNVFGHFYPSNTMGIVQDPLIEGNFNYTYLNPGSNATPTASTITDQQALTNISNYQRNNQFGLTYSFLIDNSGLQTFLMTPATQYQADRTTTGKDMVKYIQIYMAYHGGNPDSSTIIITALDINWKHIYFSPTQNPNDLNVFNTACPCPYCDVAQNVFPGTLQQ